VTPVSERLRTLRWQRGLPLHLLAQRAGAPARELMLWEQHGVAPAREIVQRVAQVLGVEEHELMQQGGLIWHTETDAPTPHRMGYGRRGAIR
jgi:transcriptional regulator with XRE-family HTH domain